MAKKDKKFLSFSLAIKEIIDDFRLYPNQYDLFANVYSFLAGGKSIVGEKECPPMGIKYGGIWYQHGNMKERKFVTIQHKVMPLSETESESGWKRWKTF